MSPLPASPQPSRLCTLPRELFEHIALHLVLLTDSFSALLPLSLTCKHISAVLSTSNVHLFVRLFHACFDSSSVLRRLGSQACTGTGFVSQLVCYTRALRVIAAGDLYAPDVRDTFWAALLMLLEDDGKNRPRLEHVGLPDFIDRFVRERLYENSISGWPAENDTNSLALWLLWLTTTQDRLRAESPAKRFEMIGLILPFVLMPVRFPAALAPPLHSELPLKRRLSQVPHSFPTAHGPYPHYLENRFSSHPFYSLTELELNAPLATIAAKLIYFSRRTLAPIATPPNLPRTPAHAMQLGRPNALTQEDVLEVTAHSPARLATHASADWATAVQGYATMEIEECIKRAPSAVWDDDWNRMMDCGDLLRPVSLKHTHYTPGLLVGLWQGMMLRPDHILYGAVMANPQMPAGFNEHMLGATPEPIFMRLREYHCMDVAPNEPAPRGSSPFELDDGVHNAWFPDQMVYSEHLDGLTIMTPTRMSHYHAYVPGARSLHDEITCRGCRDRGTSTMVFREADHEYDISNEAVAGEAGDDGMEDDESSEDRMSDEGEDMNEDAEMDVDVGASREPDAGAAELVVERKCDGIMDIVLVGETDTRHGQVWHRYRFYGRVREWDGLVALVRIPVCNGNAARSPLGVWVFTGYVVGGQTLVGNWRTATHPGEPVTFEGPFAMSKRDD